VEDTGGGGKTDGSCVTKDPRNGANPENVLRLGWTSHNKQKKNRGKGEPNVGGGGNIKREVNGMVGTSRLFRP